MLVWVGVRSPRPHRDSLIEILLESSVGKSG